MAKLIRAKKIFGILFVLSLLATNSKAAVNEQIEMFLETPAADQIITGVLYTRGWAVAPDGIARVEFYLDGSFLLEIPFGETRSDVGDLFPSYPGSYTSGFNIGLFYSRFSRGPHTATVRAIDTNGDYKEASNPFTITRFDTNAPRNYLRDESKIDFTQAIVSIDGNSILVNGMIVDGISYIVRMKWISDLQQLAISQITPVPNTSVPDTPVDIRDTRYVTADGVNFEYQLAERPTVFAPYPIFCHLVVTATNTTSSKKQCFLAITAYDTAGRYLAESPTVINLPPGITDTEKTGLFTKPQLQPIESCDEVGSWELYYDDSINPYCVPGVW